MMPVHLSALSKVTNFFFRSNFEDLTGCQISTKGRREYPPKPAALRVGVMNTPWRDHRQLGII
jgi:hypothetical protein